MKPIKSLRPRWLKLANNFNCYTVKNGQVY